MNSYMQLRDNIPPSLAERNRFFVKKGSGKEALLDGWNSSQNWLPLDEIPSDKYFGMTITDTNLALIDGDHIINATTGEVVPEAQAVLDRILQYGDTYNEYSVSGTGLHLIIDTGDYAEDFPPISNSSPQLILPTMTLSEYKSLSDTEKSAAPKFEIFYHTGGRYIQLTGNCPKKCEVATNETAAAMLRECLKMVDECHDATSDGSYNNEPKFTVNEADRNRVYDALHFIRPDDREIWIRVGMALFNCGIPFEVWDEWSKQSEKYNDGKDEPTTKKWEGFKRNSHNWNIGTIFKLAKEGGWNSLSSKTEGDQGKSGVIAKKDSLEKFHRWSKEDKDGNKKPLDIIDDLICLDICEKNNIIVVEGQPYLYQGGYYQLDHDGLKIKRMIKKHIYQQLIKNMRIEQCYKLLISDPVLHHELDELNQYPKEWINCRNGMLDVRTMKLYDHDPKYLSINQIPIEFISKEINKEGISYQFIESLIPDANDREMFLQFCGLCLTRDTSPQKSLYMIGGGGTGKSTTINMLCNVIGAENISGLSLQDINKRFYPTCLVGKLLNACADIPSMKMDTVDIIKKIIGEDVIMGEYKGGKTFFFRSYAKLLFSANKIPKVYDDKTDAYYRRLMILEIRKKAKHFDAIDARLFDDRQNFFQMILEALHRMYEVGQLYESENSKRLVRELYMDSDTVYAFLESMTKRVESTSKLSRKILYDAYTRFCSNEGRSALSAFKFREELENRGYIFCKLDGYDYVKGLGLI